MNWFYAIFKKGTEAIIKKSINRHNVTLLKYDDKLPLRKVTSSLERHYNIHITDVGVFKITNSVAKRLELPYKELIQRIRNAKVIYADETEIKVDGITYHYCLL